MLDYETFREVNQVLAPLIAALLCWRIGANWSLLWVADHARRWTRGFLGLFALTVLLVGGTARQYEAINAEAGPVSPTITVVTLLILGMCLRWPRRLRGDLDVEA